MATSHRCSLSLAQRWDVCPDDLDRAQGTTASQISLNQAAVGPIGLSIVVKIVPAGLRHAIVQIPLAEFCPKVQVFLIHHAVPVTVAGAVNLVVVVVERGDAI